MTGNMHYSTVLRGLNPYVSGRNELYSNQEPYYDWTKCRESSASSDGYAKSNWIQKRLSKEAEEPTLNLFQSSVERHEDCQSQPVTESDQEILKEDEITNGYADYTKEDLEHLNKYFEELQQRGQQQNNDEKSLIKQTSTNSSSALVSDSSESDIAPKVSRVNNQNMNKDTVDTNPKLSSSERPTQQTSEFDSSADQLIHVVNEHGIPKLRFAVKVMAIENEKNAICTVQAAQAAVEKSIKLAFPLSCKGEDTNLKKLKNIPLKDVRLRQLVLVSSCDGYARGLIEAIRGNPQQINCFGVGYVDKPGGTYAKQVFECPKEIASIPYALLRVTLQKAADDEAEPVMEVRIGEIRNVLCHAVEGNTAFGVFGEMIS